MATTSNSGGLTLSQTTTTTTSQGSSLLDINHAKFNYTVVVQVPVPFLKLNINPKMLGNFVLAQLSVLGVPQAITWLLGNAASLFNAIVEDAQDLIRAVPEATVTIQVRIGTIPVINVVLVAQDVPTAIVPPSFKLGLPNLAVDLNFAPPNLLGTSGGNISTILRVPIPVPIIQPTKLLGISGGNISATTGATPQQSSSPGTAGSASVAVAGQPATATVLPGAIVTPIVMPHI